MSGRLSTKEFRERLLAIMDRKHHWAWPYFSGPTATKPHLKLHYRQEWAVYVRDFPVFLARVYGHSPPADVRGSLAENIFEEETGRLSVGRSHPELFLRMMEGLGFSREEFEHVELLPASRRYREWLDRVSAQPRWVLGAAAATIFVEGSIHDRRELASQAAAKTPEEIERAVANHPLVRYHGLPAAALDLIRAHQLVESGHRRAAYAMVVTHARESADRVAVLTELQTGLDLWLQYRDGVALACGLTRE